MPVSVAPAGPTSYDSLLYSCCLCNGIRRDEPLPLVHGFPVRMVVPGLYGYVFLIRRHLNLVIPRLRRASPVGRA